MKIKKIKRANTLSTRFLVAGLVAVVIQMVLGMLGMLQQGWSFALTQFAVVYLCMRSSYWYGWSHGHRHEG